MSSDRALALPLQVEEAIAKTKWGEYAVSLSYNQQEIIRWIMRLHNDGRPFDVDPCYSKGAFWKGLPKPRYRYDIAPVITGIERADAAHLPLEQASVGSVMFDPPFIVKNLDRANGVHGIIERRFSAFPSFVKMFGFYEAALREFWRILRVGGIVAFKCQDQVDSRRQHIIHYDILKMSERIGYYCKDLFVLGSKCVLWSPTMANQQHARKTHSYFLVLVKEKEAT